MKLTHAIATVAGLSLCIAGCAVGQRANEGLEFELATTCTALGGTNGDISATHSSGFTEHRSYASTVTTPDGRTIKGPAGTASSTGDTPNWRWDCWGQKPGRYIVTITDEITGKQATDEFVVS